MNKVTITTNNETFVSNNIVTTVGRDYTAGRISSTAQPFYIKYLRIGGYFEGDTIPTIPTALITQTDLSSPLNNTGTASTLNDLKRSGFYVLTANVPAVNENESYVEFTATIDAADFDTNFFIREAGLYLASDTNDTTPTSTTDPAGNEIYRMVGRVVYDPAVTVTPTSGILISTQSVKVSWRWNF